MLSHVGQGAGQAIEDTVALATLLCSVGSAANTAALRIAAPDTDRCAATTGRVNGQVLDSVHSSDRDHQLEQVFAGMRSTFDYDVEAEVVRSTRKDD
jgi:salicylate hydroxylase